MRQERRPGPMSGGWLLRPCRLVGLHEALRVDLYAVLQASLYADSRSIECDVPIEANTPEEAAEQVNSTAFPLPPRHEWYGIKDWSYRVYDQGGNEVHELER
jgi:hypothetical protein